jgi:hypothetical protein
MENATNAVRSALIPLENVFRAYKNSNLEGISIDNAAHPGDIEIYSGRGGARLLTLEHAQTAYDSALLKGDIKEGEIQALAALANVWQRYMTNELDYEARRYWGKDCETKPENRNYNAASLEDVVLISTKGGSPLVTLADANQAYKTRLRFIIHSNKAALSAAA